MSSESLPTYLEPLAELLGDPEVARIYLNSADSVWVQRGERREQVDLELNPLDLEELAVQVMRRAGARPNQVHVACPLPGGVMVELVRGAAAEAGVALVLARPEPRPDGLEALLGPSFASSPELERLRSCLMVQRGVLVMGRAERIRSLVLMALADELPVGERVLLIDRGWVQAPRQPHLLRLRIDPSSGATRERLVQAAQSLGADRLVLDGLRGKEVREVLLGAGDGFGAPLVALEAGSVAQGLRHLRALAVSVGGLQGDVEELIAQRFAMAALVEPDAQGECDLLDLATLPLQPSVPARQRRSPPPYPGTAPAATSPVGEHAWPAPPAPAATAGAPQGPVVPAASSAGAAARAPETLPETRVVRDPAHNPAARTQTLPRPDAAPAPTTPASPAPAGGDIIDEMLASLRDLPGPPRAEAASGGWPAPPAPTADESDEIDDRLLFGRSTLAHDSGSLPSSPSGETTEQAVPTSLRDDYAHFPTRVNRPPQDGGGD